MKYLLQFLPFYVLTEHFEPSQRYSLIIKPSTHQVAFASNSHVIIAEVTLMTFGEGPTGKMKECDLVEQEVKEGRKSRLFGGVS